jgi:glucose-6-phosphate-specific signal transduction histidine kinase
MIGAVVLVVSLVSPVVLAWSGAWQGRVLESHTQSSGSVTTTTVVYESHTPKWLRFVVWGTAGLGLLLLVFPRREQSNG